METEALTERMYIKKDDSDALKNFAKFTGKFTESLPSWYSPAQGIVLVSLLLTLNIFHTLF